MCIYMYIYNFCDVNDENYNRLGSYREPSIIENVAASSFSWLRIFNSSDSQERKRCSERCCQLYWTLFIVL